MAVELSDAEENKNQSQIPEELMKQMAEMAAELEKLKAGERNVGVPARPSSNGDEIVELLYKKLKGEADTTPLGSFEGYTNYSEIDENDILHGDDQVTFYAPFFEYFIVDGIIKGKPVKAPFKAIKFMHEATRQVKNGKETDVYIYSTYTCKSKLELEFLMSHQMFGIKFFEKLKEVKDVDTRKAVKLAQAINSLQSMGAADLVKMCRQRNIEPSNDLQVMRVAIANHIADQNLKDDERITERIIRTKAIEESLIAK